MPLPEPVFGDILLNGEAYRIDLASYRVKDITDFSPRATVGGQGILHSELGLYQPYSKASWTHGFGFHWESDPSGYLRTDGSVDTRHASLAMLMTASTSSETNNNQKDGFAIATLNGTAYTVTWGAAGMRKLTGTTWSDEGTYGAVNFILNTATYTFVCVDGARLRLITNSTGVHANAGLNASSTDYKWLIIHNGFIYAGKDASNLIFRDDASDLSGLAGALADDPDTIVCGGGDFATIGAVEYLGKLYVSRQDGLFHIGDDNIARRVLDYSSEIASTNFRSMAVHQASNVLVYAVRDKLFRWNGTSVVDITPSRITDTFPYTTYGLFDNLVSQGRFLFCSARTNETTYNEDILCWDGAFWHKMERVVTNGSDSVSALGYDTRTERLWYHIVKTTDDTRYIQFSSQSEFPSASFPTTGTHSLITSRFDMGFRRVTKSSPSILVEAENVSASTYLTIWYDINSSGSWSEWGGTGQGQITSEGVTERFDPLGWAGSTLEYNWINFRIDFTTSAAAQTPVLEGFTLRFMMRPKTLYGHAFQIVGAQFTRTDGRRSDKLAYEIITELEAVRSSQAPVVFTDPFGVEHRGYLSSIERRAVERHGRDQRGGKPNIESVISCNFVEVG